MCNTVAHLSVKCCSGVRVQGVSFMVYKVAYMSGYIGESIMQHGALQPEISVFSKPFKLQAALG